MTLHLEKQVQRSFAVKPDLMQDPQVRAVIKENLYRGMLARPIVVAMFVVIFWWQVVQWPEPPWLIGSLIVWGLNSALYLVLHFYHRAQPLAQRQEARQTDYYLKLLVINCWIDCASLGVMVVSLYLARPDWELVVLVGAILYMFNAFFKNMSHAAIIRLQPLLIFMPLTIVFLMSGDAVHLTIAIFFLLSMVTLAMYGTNMAAIIQLPIKQRFELEALTAQLNLERDRADAANAAKSNFFTAASHDARQPLQVISLLFQSLQKSTQASDQDKNLIAKIDINLKTIRNLFDRVLDISRIDSGNVAPHMQAIRLQTLFDKLDAQFGELAASNGLWLRFVPTPEWVMHDVELLDRMVSNLVHNAIKYTPTGGVWVAWRCARKRLEVRDSGLGISASNQKNIFDEFAQLNNPARNNEAGLGLGLSIVKRLADLTHSPLGLESKLGHGSTFWLGLQATLAVDNINLVTQTAAVSNLPVLAGLHVLYTEDEPQIRMLFTEKLEEAGAVVHACSDVHQAKLVLDTAEKIDIVLTDYRLGASGSGLDLVQAARIRTNIENDSNFSTLPAILLTGDTAVKDLLSIQQLPNCTLMHKPVDFDDLANELIARSRFR